jgi:hypothetical protein
MCLVEFKKEKIGMAKANTMEKAPTQKASRFSIRASATQKRVIVYEIGE